MPASRGIFKMGSPRGYVRGDVGAIDQWKALAAARVQRRFQSLGVGVSFWNRYTPCESRIR